MQGKPEYFFHVHEKAKALALVRVRGDAREFLCTANYPIAEKETAKEWFAMFHDGIAGCSEYAWWPLTEEDLRDEMAAVGGDIEEAVHFVRCAFADFDRGMLRPVEEVQAEAQRSAGGSVARAPAAE